MATKDKKQPQKEMVYIGALVPSLLAEKLRDLARREQRTVSGQLIVLLTKALPKE